MKLIMVQRDFLNMNVSLLEESIVCPAVKYEVWRHTEHRISHSVVIISNMIYARAHEDRISMA